MNYDNDISLVRTKELDFSYNSARYQVNEAIGVFAEEVGKTGVAVEVVTTDRRDAAGWPTIRLCGPRAAVVAALTHGWDAGYTPEEMSQFVGMMLGDALAEHRWNTGCKLGMVALCPRCREAFDSDFHTCALIEPCETCGSHRINRLGEVLHTDLDCFK